MGAASADDLKTVVLNDRHLALRGRMVGFAGYALPVNYALGIMEEHIWTRTHAGLFDVSHMGPSFFSLTKKSGDAEADHAAIAALIEPLVCGDIAGLKPGQMRYTLLLNDAGGTLDDLIISRPSELAQSGMLYVVVNAGTKEADFARIAKAASSAANLVRADDGALLALQGPDAASIMTEIVPGVTGLGFMQCGTFGWEGTDITVSRAGYTGEDGFEILVPADKAALFWDRLLDDGRVRPVGLGARDSLRLEAGLPLYGHDLDETISPIEAGLGFAVAKRRREAADFPGATRILKERDGALSRVRVGLTVEGAPAREGARIIGPDGAAIGVVTSGAFSPSLKRAIALGFVPPALAAVGTQLSVEVRGRMQPASVVALPFVPHQYFRRPVAAH